MEKNGAGRLLCIVWLSSDGEIVYYMFPFCPMVESKFGLWEFVGVGCTGVLSGKWAPSGYGSFLWKKIYIR